MKRVLVVEDHDLVRLSLAAPLRPLYDVAEAATVSAALALLAPTSPRVDACVLDLRLDEPAAALHRELLLQRTPVVVVSGLSVEAAHDMGCVWGAAVLLKPVTDEALTAALDAALEKRPMPDQPPPDRTTQAPPEPPALPAPSAVPAAESAPPSSSLHPAVAIAEMITRRGARLASAAIIAWLIYHGDTSGHPLSGVAVASLSALGMGAEAFAAAVRKRPGATAAGVAGLVTLALVGEATQVGELGSLAAFGVVGATALVDRARTT